MSEPVRTSVYVPMRDGVRLAVDVWRGPGKAAAGPALLLTTRYWRAVDLAEDDPAQQGAYPIARYFTGHGFTVVNVDSRGSGASFGRRATEWSDDEAADIGEIIDWIAAQPWSDGRVAAHGFSYGGNTAFLAAAAGRPALKLIAPQFADFDIYRHNLFPGGVANLWLNDAWAALTAAQDRGDVEGVARNYPGLDPAEYTARVRGPAPVAGDHAALAEAIAAHAGNFNIAANGREVVFIDDAARLNAGRKVARALDPLSRSVCSFKAAIEASGAPIACWAGWFDAATAEGAIELFNSFSNPMRVVIGPWNHGRRHHQDPFAIGQPARPLPLEDNYADVLAAFEAPPAGRRLDYFVMGAGEWRSTEAWPPSGLGSRRLHLVKAGRLSASPPGEPSGWDRRVCDMSATTGTDNRWRTQIGCPPVAHEDRAREDRKLIVHDSARLYEALEIIGAPVARLWLRVDQPDAAVFVYLEAVAPDGRVSLLSEGRLRLMHRKLSEEAAFEAPPAHSFLRKDALPVEPGEPMQVDIRLLPLAARIPRGWRLRLAIAGADADTFARIGDAPTFEVFRSAAQPSFIELPIVETKVP
jgi:putative CocE/NonD family hydrolase